MDICEHLRTSARLHDAPHGWQAPGGSAAPGLLSGGGAPNPCVWPGRWSRGDVRHDEPHGRQVPREVLPRLGRALDDHDDHPAGAAAHAARAQELARPVGQRRRPRDGELAHVAARLERREREVDAAARWFRHGCGNLLA